MEPAEMLERLQAMLDETNRLIVACMDKPELKQARDHLNTAWSAIYDARSAVEKLS
jgi:hypothetical protein